VESVIDQVTAAFIAALQTGGAQLAPVAVVIISAIALVSFYREYWPIVMSSGAGIGDALAGAFTIILTTGLYLFVLTHLFELGMGALEAAFVWGGMLSGSQLDVAALSRPSFVMVLGLQVAAPIAQFDNWWSSFASIARLASSPNHLIALWLVLLSFGAITLHLVGVLIEFHLSLALGSVLIPWGVWRTTRDLAEFGTGWILGNVMRTLITAAMLGIAQPLIEALVTAPGPTGLVALVLPQAFTLAIGSVIFAVLCWQIPARAAGLMGRATLAVSGHTFVAAAMTGARFAQMASGAAGAIRGTSALLSR
jgi:type IV secretory pathway TrbL component